MLTITNISGFSPTAIAVLDELGESSLLERSFCPQCLGPALYLHCHIISSTLNIGIRDCCSLWCRSCVAIHVAVNELSRQLSRLSEDELPNHPAIIAEYVELNAGTQTRQVDIAFGNTNLILLKRLLEPNLGGVKLYETDIAAFSMSTGAAKTTFNEAHLSATYALSSGPRKLKVEVTQFCNLQCGFCSNPALDKRARWTYPQFEQVWLQIPKQDMQHVSFTGLGESMMNPDFWMMHAMVKRSGLSTSLVTNGMLIHKYLDKIVESRIDRIAISIETLSSQKFSSIRKNGSLEQILGNVRQLNRVLRGRQSQTKVQVLTVVLPDMETDARSVIEYCLNEGLSFPYLYPAYEHVSNNEKSWSWPTDSRKGAMIVAKLLSEYTVAGNATKICREIGYLRLNDVLQREYALTFCRDPMNTLLLRPDGRYAFCNESIFERPQKTDHAIDVGSAWLSREAMRHRIGLYYRSPPDRCLNCNGYTFPLALAEGWAV